MREFDNLKEHILKGSSVSVKPEFDYFKAWVAERMNIFWRKENNEPYPWTQDELLKNHRFTNVYRCIDKVSQYLLKNVIDAKYSKEVMLKRVLVFKHFNKIETWDLLIEHFGDIDENVTMTQISDFLETLQDVTIYNNAYMVNANPLRNVEGFEDLWETRIKHKRHLAVIDRNLLQGENFDKVMNATEFSEVLACMQSLRGTGDFTAYQYTQDLSYCPQFNIHIGDNYLIGPGTERGMERCFEFDIKDPDQCQTVFDYSILAIKEMESEDYFTALPNYDITVADVCNCFCESDKYMRGLQIESHTNKGTIIPGTRIKQKYKGADGSGTSSNYVIPEHKLANAEVWEQVDKLKAEILADPKKYNHPSMEYALKNNFIDKVLFASVSQDRVDHLGMIKRNGVTGLSSMFEWYHTIEGYLYWQIKNVEIRNLIN